VAEGPPHLVFPSEAPDRPTGPGAIVWAAAAGCPTGAGVRVDPIAAGDSPQAPLVPRSPAGRRVGPLAPIEVAAAPNGLIAIAGTGPAEHSRLLLVQGPAGGPFGPFAASGLAGGPLALADGYLGDLGILAGTADGSGLTLEVERHYARNAAVRALISGPQATGAGSVTLALDYRSDALAAWARGGELYARDLPASGSPQRVQRLGPAGAEPRIAALLSDDNRAIVLWSDGAAGRTRVFLDYSASGVRFGRPRLIESLANPDGLTPAGSPRLIRLADESVLAAWAGAAGGHWVVRTAPIDQNGLRMITTIAAPNGDALLDALAPGPRGEAVILWSEPRSSPAGQPDASRQSLMAARGFEAAPGAAHFGPAELVAPPGPVSGATVAVDPGSDGAIAAWLGEHGSIRWSERLAAPAG